MTFKLCHVYKWQRTFSYHVIFFANKFSWLFKNLPASPFCIVVNTCDALENSLRTLLANHMCLVQQKKKELYGHKQKIIDQSKGLQLIYYTVEKKKEININCQTLKCKRKRV